MRVSQSKNEGGGSAARVPGVGAHSAGVVARGAAALSFRRTGGWRFITALCFGARFFLSACGLPPLDELRHCCWFKPRRRQNIQEVHSVYASVCSCGFNFYCVL
uniref:Uncharacterized protein n=1 Tax=Knipowitschia caucasica TaxID=637954 RepID=A0AAV2MT10_KNICA